MTTFVVSHGAYQGGWIWKLVATRLRDQGHLVFAPTRKERLKRFLADLDFGDLDVMGVGPVLNQVSSAFDAYRNSGWALPRISTPR